MTTSTPLYGGQEEEWGWGPDNISFSDIDGDIECSYDETENEEKASAAKRPRKEGVDETPQKCQKQATVIDPEDRETIGED